MNILVTGGAGYIGSHLSVILQNAGYNVTIIDNLSNSNILKIDKIKHLSNNKISFTKGDLKDRDLINFIMKNKKIEVVIHLAGFKSVQKSIDNPIEYYENNFNGTVNLLHSMNKFKIYKFIFSSSATVYGNIDYKTMPIKENYSTSPINPYGTIKLKIEEMLNYICRSNKNFSSISLRYFNPIGAHESKLIGEDPSDITNNIMPILLKVAAGEMPEFPIYGNDYNTKDGTGVRDYIHVIDLAMGHLAALKFILNKYGNYIFNLGTGLGVSVLELIKTFEKSNKIKIPIKYYPRRIGDADVSYADVSLANEILQWKSKKNLELMCKSAWDYKKSFKTF